MTRRRRKRLANGGQDRPSQDRWLISYADFVTLLFAVFVVLFAYTWQSKQALRSVSTAIHTGFESLGADPPAESSKAVPSTQKGTAAMPSAMHPVKAPISAPAADPLDRAELSRQLHAIFGDAIQKQEVVLQQTPDGFIISLRELGFFNSGDAKILPEAATKLESTGKVLMQHGLQVRVEGHSDDQPIHSALYHSNWELSTARAMSVLSLLVDDGGFPPERISVAGYGPFRPLASNDTPEGRRMNRRVDLVVIAPAAKAEPTR
jgi:chemotaxis protein MotB